MRRSVLKRIALLVWICGTLACMPAFADTVTLKDGRQVSGVVESGNTQEVRIQTEGRTDVIAVDQIQSIRFGPPDVAPPPPQPSSLPSAAPPKPSPAPVPPPPPPAPSHGITLPAGTEIAVRTIDRIDSKKADLRHEYAGSLDDPIVV